MLAKEKGGDLAYAMQANSTAGRPYGLITTTGEQLAQGSAPLPANAWSHMTTTYDGATVRLYVNGALVGTKTTSGSIATTNLPLHIGGNSGNGEWFQGRLDDIRIYNRPLTATEIQTDMNTAVGPGAPPPPPPPADQVGSWTPPTDMPLVAVHSTLLPNGRVAMWSGAAEEPGSEVVFDPATETFQSTPSTRNLFCAVTVKLPDGRMAVFGGHTANFNGINDVNFYDYRTNTWQRGPDMSRGRWYPVGHDAVRRPHPRAVGRQLRDPAGPAGGPPPAPVVDASRDLRPGDEPVVDVARRGSDHALLPADVRPAGRAGLRCGARHDNADAQPGDRDLEHRGHEPDRRAQRGDVPARARSSSPAPGRTRSSRTSP